MALCLIAAASPTLAASSSISLNNDNLPAGRCDEYTILPKGTCCSWHGYSGTTDEFCGSMCLYNCPNDRNSTSLLPVGAKLSKDGRCDRNTICPTGSCCSQWGFCGTSNLHCNTNCQFQCTSVSLVDPGQLEQGDKRPENEVTDLYCEEDDTPYDELPICEDLPPFEVPTPVRPAKDGQC
ncbi:hypothetical protein H4R33_001958 [Dimargaris cristalligena]|nr:hypothetical protein H4R33_001958 [Dimargaris cristalligena]